MPETKTAITANPAANSAKAANSSCTKYNCAATTAARNHHIHLRLLSSVLVIGLVSVPLGHLLVKLASCSMLCGSLSVWAWRLAPEPLDTSRKPKSMVHKVHFEPQTSFLVPNLPIRSVYLHENKACVIGM